MRTTLKKIALVTAEVLLVVAILALLVANWMPIVVGARSFRATN
jgi:hypothetical protein